jgi:hypothetical protein
LNPYRLSAALSGTFRLVVLALRQQGGVRRDENHSKIARRQVQGSFHGADFCSGEQNRTANTDVFARDFSNHGRKSRL